MPTGNERIGGETETAEAPESSGLTAEQKEAAAFQEFDAAIAEVRKSLAKGGHLELVTSEGYRTAQKKLIETVGRRPAELFLNHWFAKNSAN